MEHDTKVVTNDTEILDEVVIEEYGKCGKKPPKAKFYVIRIDKTTYKIKEELITGKELLELAGKQPIEQYKIFQKIHGGQRKEISHDEVVDLRAKGIERFQTVPLAETEG